MSLAGKEREKMNYANYSYLETPEDIEWLRSTHIPTLAADVLVVVLDGNEDSPERCACYTSQNPYYAADPDYLFTYSEKEDKLLVDNG